MKKFLSSCILAFVFSNISLAQKPKPPRKTSGTAPKTTVENPLNEESDFAAAQAEVDLTKRIALLQKFASDFPNSANRVRAQEMIVSARAQIGDEKLRFNETGEGIQLFKLAVSEAPVPISDVLFNKVILQFPGNLLLRGQPRAALEVADLIEEKIATNPNQLLALAAFQISAENASGARRISEKIISLGANSAAAFQMLGLAHRMNFDLEQSAAAYSRALEIDPKSLTAKRSLAEMKRALGQSVDALSLYREIAATDPNDSASQAGIVLSLFDSGKQTEAESEFAKTFQQNPNNLMLLTGAAYWYAANGFGEKAFELGTRAVAAEARYAWAHIALARALLAQKKPLEAEKTLLIARNYGNFPTLDYELASARLAAGFYEDAAAELRKDFVEKDGMIETRLGGRVTKSAQTFTELLALERRASIFQPAAADDPQSASQLKSLLNFTQALEDSSPDEKKIAAAAEAFVGGDDRARTHRSIFAASRLLRKRILFEKIHSLNQNAIAGLDSALEVPSASAATLADELFESRASAFSRGELVIVPDVPATTLTKILRGRIEEIDGWAYFYQFKNAEAVTHLKRAVSIAPEKSAWWRSSLWRLGTALEADGKPNEALDAYIRSYTNSAPDQTKRSTIENLYTKIFGSTEGLEERLTAVQKDNATFKRAQIPANAVAKNVQPEKIPDVVPRARDTVAPTPTQIPAPALNETVAQPTPMPVARPTATQIPAPTETIPQPTPVPSPTASPIAAPTETVPEPTTLPSPTPMSSDANSLPVSNETVAKQVETQPQVIAPEIPKENAPTEIAADKSGEKKEEPKPLFEPIVITVPSANSPPSKSDTESTEVTDEKKPGAEATNKRERKVTVGAGDTRPRVVVTELIKENVANDVSCSLSFGQDKVSIINNGGSFGLLVGLKGEGKISDVLASSKSPNDVSVSVEPDTAENSNRAFFVIKSISENRGVFTVTFESPCGKKEVLVSVR